MLVLKPCYRWLGGWTGAFAINALIATYFLIFGVGFGIWAAISALVSNVHQYSVFARCYQVSWIVRCKPDSSLCPAVIPRMPGIPKCLTIVTSSAIWDRPCQIAMAVASTATLSGSSAQHAGKGSGKL
jgi:hypothetical protein